jgi:hypothetical protein
MSIEEIKNRMNLSQFDGLFDWSIIGASHIKPSADEELLAWMGVTASLSADDEDSEDAEEDDEVDIAALVDAVESDKLREILDRLLKSKSIRSFVEKCLKIPRLAKKDPNINSLFENEDWPFINALMAVSELVTSNEGIVDSMKSFKSAWKAVKKQVNLKRLFQLGDIVVLDIAREFLDIVSGEEVPDREEIAQLHGAVHAAKQHFLDCKEIRKSLGKSVKEFSPQDQAFFESFMNDAIDTAKSMKGSVRSLYREMVADEASRSEAENAVANLESGCSSIYAGLVGLLSKFAKALLTDVATAADSFELGDGDGDAKTTRLAAAAFLKSVLPIFQGLLKLVLSIDAVASTAEADVLRGVGAVVDGLQTIVNQLVHLFERSEDETFDAQIWADQMWASVVAFWDHAKGTVSATFPEFYKLLITDGLAPWFAVPAEVGMLLRAIIQVKCDEAEEPSLDPIFAVLKSRAGAVGVSVESVLGLLVLLTPPAKKSDAQTCVDEIKSFLDKMKSFPDEFSRLLKVACGGLAAHDEALSSGAVELWHLLMEIVESQLPGLPKHLTRVLTPFMKRLRSFYKREGATANAVVVTESEPSPESAESESEPAAELSAELSASALSVESGSENAAAVSTEASAAAVSDAVEPEVAPGASLAESAAPTEPKPEAIDEHALLA